MQRQFFALWTVRGVSWSKRELEGSIYGLSNWHFKVAPSCFLCLSLWTFLHVSLSLILGGWFISGWQESRTSWEVGTCKSLISWQIVLQDKCVFTSKGMHTDPGKEIMLPSVFLLVFLYSYVSQARQVTWNP